MEEIVRKLDEIDKLIREKLKIDLDLGERNDLEGARNEMQGVITKLVKHCHREPE